LLGVDRVCIIYKSPPQSLAHDYTRIIIRLFNGKTQKSLFYSPGKSTALSLLIFGKGFIILDTR
jgi:hypothetical protein